MEEVPGRRGLKVTCMLLSAMWCIGRGFFWGRRYEQDDHKTRYENLIEAQSIIKNIVEGGKKTTAQRINCVNTKKIYSLAANFYLSLSCCHYLVFLNACQKRSFISFDLQQRNQTKNLFSWPGTTYYKKTPLGLIVTCGPTRIWAVPHFGVLSPAQSCGIPSPGHRLKRAAPQQMGCSSIQSFSIAAWMQTL